MNVALCSCSPATAGSSPPIRRTTKTRSSSSFRFPSPPLSFPASTNPTPISLPFGRPVDAEETAVSSTRRLILLRHADSSWEDPSLRDHDRPLSVGGRDDAASVSHKLQNLGWVPQLILSSNAVRTSETLLIMQEQVKSFLEAEVHLLSSFYSVAAMDGQTAQHLQKIICNLSGNHILTVMCMGHNKGWQEAATVFSGTPVELKTCHAALLQATGRSWEEAFSSAGFGGWKLQGIVGPNGDF